MSARPEARVLRAADHGPLLPIVLGDGTARAIVWPGIAADKGTRVVSVGGPCPADYGLLRAVGTWPSKT